MKANAQTCQIFEDFVLLPSIAPVALLRCIDEQVADLGRVLQHELDRKSVV